MVDQKRLFLIFLHRIIIILISQRLYRIHNQFSFPDGPHKYKTKDSPQNLRYNGYQ